MREKALKSFDNMDLTQDEASQLVKFYQQRDANHQYHSFCAAIIYFLSTYY